MPCTATVTDPSAPAAGSEYYQAELVPNGGCVGCPTETSGAPMLVTWGLPTLSVSTPSGTCPGTSHVSFTITYPNGSVSASGQLSLENTTTDTPVVGPVTFTSTSWTVSGWTEPFAGSYSYVGTISFAPAPGSIVTNTVPLTWTSGGDCVAPVINPT